MIDVLQLPSLSYCTSIELSPVNALDEIDEAQASHNKTNTLNSEFHIGTEGSFYFFGVLVGDSKYCFIDCRSNISISSTLQTILSPGWDVE